jgi:hypothetical protein
LGGKGVIFPVYSGSKKKGAVVAFLRLTVFSMTDGIFFFFLSGVNGSVNRCVHINTQVEYAVKRLKKENLIKEKYERLKQEIKIMQELDHPNILRIHESFETKDAIYIITEVCKGKVTLQGIVRGCIIVTKASRTVSF